jgi:hypothetical protein
MNISHRGSDADGRAGVTDWTLTRPGGTELVTGEADGQGPAISGFDKKWWPFRPKQESNSDLLDGCKGSDQQAT